MNRIYLRRRCKVHVKPGTEELPLNVIASMQKNLESLGFAISEELAERLRSLSVEKLGSFYRNLVSDLREMVGAHREFRPMYPNFPQQVMDMTAAELYWNAFVHYVTNLRPKYEKMSRSTLNERTRLKTVELGSREDFEGIFTHLAGSKSSLSDEDKADLAWFVAQYRDDVFRLMPTEIPLKENVALLGAEVIRHTSAPDSFLKDKIKTATDALRLAVALSDGDVSLADPVKFRNFKRSERRLLLSKLEQCSDPTEDMLRWKERWKRLGERLHPGDFQQQFPKTYAAFGTIRKNLPCRTFNQDVESRLLKRDVEGVLRLVGKRPGDLARRLDHLIRLGDADKAISAFGEQVDRVSTPVLLQVLTHFKHRPQPKALRSFFPKGGVAKVYATTRQLSPLPREIAQSVVKICEDTLVARFSKLNGLGKCYLDPRLSDYHVPFSQRSASKGLRTLVRGSKLPMPKCEFVRFFVWWKNGRSRVDIDLSAALYDAEFRYVDVISYYNLKNFGGHHSGDIVDAPSGAAEFIDLNIDRTKTAGARYVVMALNSFTEQPYCDLPECFAGWMARTDANSGEIFEPKTVQDKIDITANTRICLPAILDLVERQVIWADVALRKGLSWNNVQNNLSGMSLTARAVISMVRPDLWNLFDLHIRARGKCVADKSRADMVFSVEEGITPFDTALITSEFL